ncbi:hypothetical protein BJ684DRAFT_19769, partial [Piptocephalis cylindrospora]
MVRALLRHGADASRVNLAGESALMRAVLVTNGYERGVFEEMLSLLGASVGQRDYRGRTLLHHIAGLA